MRKYQGLPFTIVIVGLSIAAILLMIGLAARKSSFTERAIEIKAALNKKKSFDGKHHEFALQLRLRVHEKDLFKFNDANSKISNNFYRLITSQKADIKGADQSALEKEIITLLIGEKIQFKDLRISIRQIK